MHSRALVRLARLLAAPLVLAAVLAGPARAQDARLLGRLAPVSADFLGLRALDLSRFSTASRSQWPTGDCVGFSHIAAIEARFNHKYCASGAANDFRRDGYCARFDAVSRTPFYVFGLYGAAWSDTYLASLKEVDLAEHYYLHRVFTQATAQAGAARDTLTMYNFADQMVPDMSVLMAGQVLSEERYAPFINDQAFWAASGSASVVAFQMPANFPQSKVDPVELAETPFPTTLPGSAVARVPVPLDARTHARFRVTDIYHGRLGLAGATASARILFLERLLYSGYEVALHGAQPGHSMLLVGFDRDQKKFYFKDHYRRWVSVDYATAANADSYTVALDVDYLAQPSREEMWLGVWDADIDGRVGELTLRRTRQPTNSYFSTATATNNFFDAALVEMPKDKWARVGSYVYAGIAYRVLGRLGADGDDGTMEVAIDWGTRDGGASPVAAHQAGFLPTTAWQILRLTLVSAGPGAGAYAVGETTWNNLAYGALLQRRGHRELGAVSHTPDTFARSKWNTIFHLHFSDGSAATLYPSIPASGPGTAWLLDAASGRWIALQAWVTQDNAVLFYTSDTSVPRYQSMRLLMHTWEKAVVSGMDNLWLPVFGSFD